MYSPDKVVVLFLSTPSARRATAHPCKRRRTDGISIHALREEGDHDFVSFCIPVSISIHALREEGDVALFGLRVRSFISIHALREEGDIFPILYDAGHRTFLSTPSARRATSSCV